MPVAWDLPPHHQAVLPLYYSWLALQVNRLHSNVCHRRNKKDVEWKAGSGQPSAEQLKQLWSRLESLSSLDALEAWPLLPVRGRHLRRLHKSSQVHCDKNVLPSTLFHLVFCKSTRLAAAAAAAQL